MAFEPAELLPGLVVRRATEADVPSLAGQMIESGLYPQPAAEVTALAAGWVASPRVWPFVVTWRGEELQYDTYHFQATEVPAGGSLDEQVGGLRGWAKIRGGFNVHLDRERPHWFYREVGRPMLAALYQAGGRSMTSPIRADRPEWVAYLRQTYRASEIGRRGRAVLLRYDLGIAMRAGEGWPERRTLGPAWAWQGPTLRLRESTDLDRVDAALQTLWGAEHPRLPIMRRALDRCVHLDRGTVLIAEDGTGVVRDVRVVRFRRGQTCTVATLGPFSKSFHPEACYAMAHWYAGVGYQRVTSFVRTADLHEASLQRGLARVGGHLVREHRQWREPFAEMAWPVRVPATLAEWTGSR